MLLITHYQRLLNYIQPDFVHVLADGKIIKTGDKFTNSGTRRKKGYEIRLARKINLKSKL